MLNQIITSSALIFAVIVVRKIFDKYISQRFVYSLWLLVAIKLLLPISIDNPFLFTNFLQTKATPQSQTELNVTQKNDKTNNYENYNSSDSITTSNNLNRKRLLNKQYSNYENNDTSKNTIRTTPINRILLFIWISGIFITAGSLLINNLIFYFKLKKDRQYMKIYKTIKIYTTSCVNSPCLFGLFSPKIYIPSKWKMTKQQQKYIFLHEWTHYKHKDTFWAFVRCLCLSIYWFHPMVWLAGYLSKKDCETACDEKVIAILDKNETACYGRVLVDMCNLASNINRNNLFIQEFRGGNKEMKRRLGFIVRKNNSIWGVMLLATAIMICVTGCTFGQNKVSSKKTVSTTDNVKSQNKETEDIIPVNPVEITLSDTTGADGATLYYADENNIIFGGYFGLFVYDTQNRKMLRSIDLKKIGCDATQGDNYCQINVSKDGTTVYMHKISSDEMYLYNVTTNTLSKTKYDEGTIKNIALYSVEQDGSACYLQNSKEVSVYLLNAWNCIGQLAYEYSNDGFARHIFVPDEYKNTEVLKKSDLSNIKKIEMFINGEIYSCSSKEACKYLEEHMKDAKKISGGSGCPFYDEMYITLADGTKGVIYPATDSCNIILTEDGYFEWSNSSDNKEFWNLLGWNLDDVRK